MMRGRIAILVSAFAAMMLTEALGLVTGIAISVLAWTAWPPLDVRNRREGEYNGGPKIWEATTELRWVETPHVAACNGSGWSAIRPV
jgi:hypothetical protein